MKTSLVIGTSLALLIGFSGIAQAEKVYKWVDEKGVVHYGGQPPERGAKEIDVKVPKAATPPPTPAGAPAAAAPAPQGLTPEEEKRMLEEKAAQETERQAAIEKNCDSAKQRAALMKRGGRIFDIDANGEPHYYSDDDIKKGLEEAEANVEKWCNQGGES